MSAGRPSRFGRTVSDMRYVEPGPDYKREIVEAIGQNGAVSSLVCNGAIPMYIDETAEPRDDLLGRNLINSFVTDAYNAVCEHYGKEKKVVEHCMYRTTGDVGYVMDLADRVWSERSAGAYMLVEVSTVQRQVVLGTADQVLSEEAEVRPVQRALLDALLLPLVQLGNGTELSCEAMMYVSTTFDEMKKQVTPDDLAVVKSGLSKVEGCTEGTEVVRKPRDTANEFTSNLLGVLSALLGLPTPGYMTLGGQSREFADILCMPDTQAKDFFVKDCLKYKLWIEYVNDRDRSGLLIAAFLDRYTEWGGGHPAVDEFARELLENEWALPQPLDLYNFPHRAITAEEIMGVSSITEITTVQGGKLMPAEFGQITTEDFSGRLVGTVDKRRIVAYFDDNGDLVVQFKNIRNYFLNILYFARPGKFVQTEVREAVVDRDKLVGLPALHMLLRGQTNSRLARFTIAALTFGAVSVKRRSDRGIGGMLGTKHGKYDFQGIASPSVLAAFPTLFDSEQRLYLYHDGATYRAKCRGFFWNISREDMKMNPVGFGTLASALPIKSWSRENK